MRTISAEEASARLPPTLQIAFAGEQHHLRQMIQGQKSKAGTGHFLSMGKPVDHILPDSAPDGGAHDLPELCGA